MAGTFTRRVVGSTLATVMTGLTVLMLIAPSHADTARIQHRERFCRYGSVDGTRTWTHHEVRKTIACATQRWGVSYDTALAIFIRESGLNEHAENTVSHACGIGQHLPAYWPGRVANFNRNLPRWNAGPSCFNPRSNVLVSVKMMATVGFGPWSL